MQESLKELLAILESRRDMYRVLARLFEEEVTPDFLDALKALKFPEASESADFNAAAVRFNAFAAALSPEGLDDLAADYARTFLGAGVADEPTAYPFESVYTSREHLIMQDAYEAMLGILRKHGMAPAKPDLYADHFGVELEFMGLLAEKAAKALEADDATAAEALLEESKTFLTTHLLNWADPFLNDLVKVGRTDFYKALADVTRLYLAEDRAWLEG